MPAKGTLAWIHRHNMGSPIFGDPDAMINTRSVDAEMFDSFEKVSIDVGGELEDVLLDATWGPLVLQPDGSGRFMEFSRNHAAWRQRTSTDQNTRIQMVAKMNRRTRQ